MPSDEVAVDSQQEGTQLGTDSGLKAEPSTIPSRTSSPLSPEATSFVEDDSTTVNTGKTTPTASSMTNSSTVVSSPSTTAEISSSKLLEEPPISTPQLSASQSTTDIIPIPPHRKPRRRNAPPIKGILKPSTIPTARFSFRRDILQSFNSRLAYATSLSANNGATTSPTGGPATANPAAAVGNGVEVFKNVVTAAAGTGQGAAAAAGGFFGNAFKRFSNGVATVAGAPIVPQRDLSEDNAPTPLHRDQRYSPVLDSKAFTPNTTESVDDADSSTSSAHHAINSRSKSPLSPHSSPIAPHTPTRGHATSGKATSTPYVTVHSPAHASTTAATPPAPPPLSVGELKRVRFRMASLKVVYPINGPNGPIAPYEESKTRKRINIAHREAQQNKTAVGGDAKGWTGEDLGKLYAECCRTREEPGIERLKRLFRENPKTPPRILDLSNELLSHGAVEALSDLLSVDFGLKKLVLESCGLDDESLRPLLHALLVSGSIPTISIAKNKRIRSKGWKYIAVFIRKAHFLRYLDVSDNAIDRKAADLIVQALMPHSVEDGEKLVDGLSGTGLGVIEGHGEDGKVRENGAVPASDWQISQAPEMARMEKKLDEKSEDMEGDEDEEELQPMFMVAPLLKEDPANRPGSLSSMRLENCNLRGAALEALAHGVRASTLKHISIRRNKIPPTGGVALAIMIRDYPVATDHSDSATTSPVMTPSLANPNPFESGNSVTARHALREPFTKKNGIMPNGTHANNTSVAIPESAQHGHPPATSEAAFKLRRQIEELPRTGSLLTLDIKGNDLRNGISYVATVLKRNRTLKVLNVSENKIDMQGLVALAEALKSNGTLETLDLSYNPCCGPSLEGIISLRSAITVNSNLKRVFLNHTDLTSEGAIALSEFLPEAKSLIHLDLTGNNEIDIAGVLALSVSVKMNTTLRCLDLNIPPNDSDFARLSQEILQCCIRNTEQAQEEATSGGKKITIAAPILKSAVARDLKERQDAQERQERRRQQQAQSKDEILNAAEGVRDVLSDMLAVDEALAKSGVIVQPAEVVRDSLVQAQLAEAQLAEAIAATRSGDRKDRAVQLGDALSALLDRAKALYDPTMTPPPPPPKSTVGGGALSPVIDESSSPAFSLGDSDSEGEGEGPQQHGGDSVTDSSSSLAHPTLSLPTTPVMEQDTFVANSPRSPMESQSRSLTLEEGEIFRKGSALGTGQVDDEDDELEDVSGEQLKKEILEAKIERSPRGSLTGQDGEARPEGLSLAEQVVE